MKLKNSSNIHFLRNTTPASLDITLDKLARKNVPVQADWKGTLPAGILISSVSFKPEIAIISGPSLLLNDISTVYTNKIPLENITKSGKMDVNLDINNKVKIENSINGKFTMEYLVEKKETLETADQP